MDYQKYACMILTASLLFGGILHCLAEGIHAPNSSITANIQKKFPDSEAQLLKDKSETSVPHEIHRESNCYNPFALLPCSLEIPNRLSQRALWTGQHVPHINGTFIDSTFQLNHGPPNTRGQTVTCSPFSQQNFPLLI